MIYDFNKMQRDNRTKIDLESIDPQQISVLNENIFDAVRSLDSMNLTRNQSQVLNELKIGIAIPKGHFNELQNGCYHFEIKQ